MIKKMLFNSKRVYLKPKNYVLTALMPCLHYVYTVRVPAEAGQ